MQNWKSRKNPKHYTADEIRKQKQRNDEIVRLYRDENQDITEIMKNMNLTYRVVWFVLKLYNIPRRKTKPYFFSSKRQHGIEKYDLTDWSEEKKLQFLKDYETAVPLEKIMTDYSIPDHRVLRRFLMLMGYLPSRIYKVPCENGTEFDTKGRRVVKKRHLKKHWEIDVDMMKFFR